MPRRRRFLHYETKQQPLLEQSAFLRRLLGNFAVASALIAASLVFGMAGYIVFEDMNLIDAFANAAMILSGMGPLGPLKTDAGKLFAGFYALYSGLALILATGLLVAPLLHRLLHRFHLNVSQN
jgi:hypothetical protein